MYRYVEVQFPSLYLIRDASHHMASSSPTPAVLPVDGLPQAQDAVLSHVTGEAGTSARPGLSSYAYV